MKVAFSGKGGVGKTTLAAGLARHWSEQGLRVVAVDADPDANLAVALGASREVADACVPLSEMDDLIEERTGSRPGSGGMFRLNPDASDVVESCGTDIGGVTLLRMGTIERGGSGCMCSESVFLKAFMQDVLGVREDAVVLDMEAGIEHLGRGTAESVDVMVVVVEPGSRSLQTAGHVAALARDIGISRVVAVGNKVRSAEDEQYLRSALDDLPLLAAVPESEGVRQADREGSSPYDMDPEFADAVGRMAEAIVQVADEQSVT